MYDGVGKYAEKDVDLVGRKPEFEMLFDLEKDPGEMNNLAAAHATRNSKILVSLRKKTAAHSNAANKERQRFVAEVAVAKGRGPKKTKSKTKK